MLPIERFTRWLATKPARCKYCNVELGAGQDTFCSQDCALDHLA
jgi:nitrate reductase beta subunit